MHAVTRLLSDFTPDQIDLNSFAGDEGNLFVRDGVGFAGRGVAARVPSHQAKTFLSAITVDDTVNTVGSGPILFGAIPFDSADTHDFLLPKTTLCKSADGRCWVTLIDDAQLDLTASPISNASNASNANFTVTDGVAIDVYLRAVAAVRDAVRSGQISKAVIARDVIVHSDLPIDIPSLLQHLRKIFGLSYRYMIDGLVGASPELLVAASDGDISSHPLAGTAPRTGDVEADAQLASQLLASAKNQIEHRIVIDAVHDTLLPWCSFLDWEPQASIVQVANVQHLGTHMSGRLSQPFVHVLDAVYALSPTPALGGHPRDKALQLIAQHEGMSRGRYGGAVGWCDSRGNGTWAVAIRCAEFSADRKTARLFAGGGIVADSEPEIELAETRSKMQAMLTAIIRP